MRGYGRLLVSGKKIGAVVILCAVLTCCGCIERSLTVAVDDALGTYQVYIDGKHRGPAPHTENFAFYGTHEVMLVDETGRVSRRIISCSAPWYEYFPLDFFPLVLYPGMLTQHQEFMLAPSVAAPIDLAAIEARAAAFRTDFQEAFPEDE